MHTKPSQRRMMLTDTLESILEIIHINADSVRRPSYIGVNLTDILWLTLKINHINVTQCDKAFSRKNDLDRHFRKHTGEKPYQCNQCDKTFSVKSDFDKHSRKNVGDKSYQYSQCDMAFSLKISFKTWNAFQNSHWRVPMSM